LDYFNGVMEEHILVSMLMIRNVVRVFLNGKKFRRFFN
jgi:hypothetical protein